MLIVWVLVLIRMCWLLCCMLCRMIWVVFFGVVCSNWLLNCL